MPLHFEDLDVISASNGVRSALIVPCNICPAATIAARENRPVLKILSNFLKSRPFEEYLSVLQDRLKARGVRSKVFRNIFPHQWFLCLWTGRRQRNLQRAAKKYGAVIVLGCESATQTVRDAVEPTGCRVIEGMKTTGIMNTKLSLQFPCDICFKDSKVIPLAELQSETQPYSGGKHFNAAVNITPTPLGLNRAAN